MITRSNVVLLLFIIALVRSTLSTLSRSICVENTSSISCREWKLDSSWTQGGYRALCTRKNSPKKFHLTVFVVRNVYNCVHDTKKKNEIKIVNNYYDVNGKLCHLSKGDEMCPGFTDRKKLQDEWLKVWLHCEDLECNLRYHRCDFCKLAPWYSWMSSKLMRGKQTCKDMFSLANTFQRGRRRGCFKCDGSKMGKSFCQNRQNMTRYFVDLKSSKPSWSEWNQISRCENASQIKCGNGTSKGIATYGRNCRYSRNKIKLRSEYCGSQRSSIKMHCEIELQPCHAMANSTTAGAAPVNAHAWLIVVSVLLVIAFISAFWIYFKYIRLKAETRGDDCNFLARGIFSSCATQTSPHYSPTRIISEPEYALIGNWRHNVAKSTKSRKKVSFADGESNIFWGSDDMVLSDDCISESSDEKEGESNLHSSKEFKGHYRPKERCELEASKRRALFAKSSTSSSNWTR